MCCANAGAVIGEMSVTAGAWAPPNGSVDRTNAFRGRRAAPAPNRLNRRWPGSTRPVMVGNDARRTNPARALHDPGDRDAEPDTLLRRLLRRQRHRPGCRTGDLLRVPRPQRRGEVDDDQDA